MIDRKDIERLAELSRIQMNDGEMEAMRKDIDSILGYVGQIQEVAGNLSEKPQAGTVRNIMREDENPHESGIFTEDLLSEAPSREGNYVKVKKILGGSGLS